MFKILQEIEKDPNVTQEAFLPNFRVLREWTWTKPLIYIYTGGTWSLDMFPWRLSEVSRTFFSVPHSHQWCSPAPPYMQDEVRMHTLCGFRYNLMGTSFVVERYEAFLLTSKQQHTPSIERICHHPPKSSIVRICVNDGERTKCEEAVHGDITNCDEHQLRKMFFRSIVPLLGNSTKQMEKRRDSSLSRHSLGSAESGGPSAENSSRDTSEEVSMNLMTFKSNCDDTHLFQGSSNTKHTPEDGEEMVCDSVFGGVRVTCMPRRCGNVISLFDQEDRYRIDVTEAWVRWANDWDGAIRSGVVSSIDEILTSLEVSREAVHVSVAYLDAFLSASQKVVQDPTYFTGVVLACAMLACKQLHRSFPSISSFLSCLHPDSQIHKDEFFWYERHVLEALSFRLHPLTVLDVVETLLELCAGHRVQKLSENQRRRSDWSRLGFPGPGQTADHIVNSEAMRWSELCNLARFFTDLVLRSTKAHCFRPTTVGVAVLVVAAEKAKWTLPAKLTDILQEGVNISSSGHARTRHSACRLELDESEEKLIALFAHLVRVRGGREARASVSAAVEAVRECRRGSAPNTLKGVLGRRYNIQ